MSKITHEIRQLQIELKHTGSCTTKGLTEGEIARLDERFFLSFKTASFLKNRFYYSVV
ncbi:ABC transporter ATP-binding protein [Acinetobacter baumannii]|nr:ABC transporter ATP-binding protein [Acinetobacter baumannii]